MPEHEQKQCGRCSRLFECRAGAITNCQCSGIFVSKEVRAFIASKYTDCLCFECLKKLSNQCDFFIEKYFRR